MNYLTEIKLFYDWLETHELTPSAILLWHGLMFIANRAGWEQPLTVPMNAIEARTMMTRSSIYRARKVLEELQIYSSGFYFFEKKKAHPLGLKCLYLW